MDRWFCRQGGVAAGPFSLEELKYLASRGKVQPGDLVRRGDNGTWNEASSVKGLLAQSPTTSTVQQTIAPVVRERTHPTAEVRPAETSEDDKKSAVALTTQSPPTTRSAPPPLSPQQDSQRRDQRLLAGIAALLLLLLLLLVSILWFLNAPQLYVAKRATVGTGSGRQQEAGSGNLESQGNQTAGETGGRPTPGSGGKKLEEQEKDQPRAEPPQESPNPQPEEVQAEPDDQIDPNQGGKPPHEEEVPPDEVGLTIREFVPQELNDEDSVLGGGQVSGPQPEMFQGRDPEKRAELAEKEGGSPESEAAVELGLKWLVDHQDKDGRWSLDRYMVTGDCNQQCRHAGIRSDTAATGLALMPLLGAGHTHGKGKYKAAVRRGLDFLVKDQNAAGSFNSIGGGNMYAHGIASIALCEAYAMTKDKTLKKPAQKAVDYICQAQHAAGGWRYGFRSPGDTSVMGWQILALKSAQSAGLRIPKDVLPKANRYLDSAQADKLGGTYSYMPGMSGNPTPSMSAEGLLCRMYCGWPKDARGLDVGVEYLLQHLPDQEVPNVYYWYYATQVLHHNGGKPWLEWNEVMRDTLIELQVQDGHEAGSWTPQGGHASVGGRIYMTALALCTLEVYYRHAALFD